MVLTCTRTRFTPQSQAALECAGGRESRSNAKYGYRGATSTPMALHK